MKRLQAWPYTRILGGESELVLRREGITLHVLAFRDVSTTTAQFSEHGKTRWAESGEMREGTIEIALDDEKVKFHRWLLPDKAIACGWPASRSVCSARFLRGPIGFVIDLLSEKPMTSAQESLLLREILGSWEWSEVKEPSAVSNAIYPALRDLSDDHNSEWLINCSLTPQAYCEVDLGFVMTIPEALTRQGLRAASIPKVLSHSSRISPEEEAITIACFSNPSRGLFAFVAGWDYPSGMTREEFAKHHAMAHSKGIESSDALTKGKTRVSTLRIRDAIVSSYSESNPNGSLAHWYFTLPLEKCFLLGSFNCNLPDHSFGESIISEILLGIEVRAARIGSRSGTHWIDELSQVQVDLKDWDEVKSERRDELRGAIAVLRDDRRSLQIQSRLTGPLEPYLRLARSLFQSPATIERLFTVDASLEAVANDPGAWTPFVCPPVDGFEAVAFIQRRRDEVSVMANLLRYGVWHRIVATAESEDACRELIARVSFIKAPS